MFEKSDVRARGIGCKQRCTCIKHNRNRQRCRGGNLRRPDEMDRCANVAEVAREFVAVVGCRRRVIRNAADKRDRRRRWGLIQGMDVAECNDELEDERKERRLPSKKTMSSEPLHERQGSHFSQ